MNNFLQIDKHKSVLVDNITSISDRGVYVDVATVDGEVHEAFDEYADNIRRTVLENSWHTPTAK